MDLPKPSGLHSSPYGQFPSWVRCQVSVAEVSPYPVVGPKRVAHELSVLLGAQAGLSRFGPESD